MTLTPDNANFTAAGPDFSTAGGFDSRSFPPAPIGIDFPIAFGDSFEVLFDAGTAGALRSMSLTVGGVPWAIPPGPDGGSAFVFVESQPSSPITGPGPYSAPFVFGAAFFGEPIGEGNGNCPMISGCPLWVLAGHGTMELNVVPYPSGSPDTFEPVSATFTFNAPEPSSTSLLLIGFAGLAVLSRRRMLRATALISRSFSERD